MSKLFFSSKLQLKSITLPSGRKFTYTYDSSSSGLSKISLPSGASHSLSLQSGFGYTKLYYTLPGFSEPHTTYWSGTGRLLRIRPPGSNGIRIFEYEGADLSRVVAGDQETVFTRHPDGSGWLRRVEHELGGFTMKLSELRGDQAADDDMMVQTAERRINFAPESGYASAKFVFEFNANAGLGSPRVSGRIGGQTIPDYFVHQRWGLSGLKHSGRAQIGHFSCHLHSLNESTLSDAAATFSRTSDSERLVVNGREVVRVEKNFDCDDRIESSHYRLEKANGVFRHTWRYKYDDDGMLDKASLAASYRDGGEWRYKYDLDGNLVSVTSNGKRTTFSHDKSFGGRMTALKKDQERSSSTLKYDDLGRVARNQNEYKFEYTSGDLLSRVVFPGSGSGSGGGSVSYHYDHQGRLVGRQDTAGNSTQFFYTDASNPYAVSHVYWPKRGAMTALVYDDRGFLVFADAGAGSKFYVFCDASGSPTHFVTPKGDLEREVGRMPYGAVTFDYDVEGVAERIPIGFAGGIFDPDVGIVHLMQQVRIYISKGFVHFFEVCFQYFRGEQ
jgi:YD repeat-containing protein